MYVGVVKTAPIFFSKKLCMMLWGIKKDYLHLPSLNKGGLIYKFNL